MKEVFYVYRHIRKDLNIPFYIGIGKVYNLKANNYERYYSRAFQMTKRNRFWKFIKEKSDIEIEIIFETTCRQDALNKEIEFIALYGRRDLNKGTLVNLTDGGEGMNNNIQSEETLDKRREMYREGKTGLKPLKGGDSPRAIKMIEEKTGRIFNSQSEAAKYLNIKVSIFNAKVNHHNNQKNDTGFRFLDDSLNKEHTCRKTNRKVYNFKKEIVYDSVSKASVDLGISVRFLGAVLKGKYTNKYDCLYYEDYLNGLKPTDLFTSKKKMNKVINTETNEIYESVKGMCKKLNLNSSTIESKLKGKVTNDTPYQLLEDYEKGLSINWNLRELIKPETELIDFTTKEIYKSIGDAAKKLNINFNTLANYLNPKCPNRNKTTLIYYSDYLNGDIPKIGDIAENVDQTVINRVTGETYSTPTELAKILGIRGSTLCARLAGRMKNDTDYQYLRDYKNGVEINCNYSKQERRVKLIDKVTLIKYDSYAHASRELEINISTLHSMLKGNIVNKTNLVILSDYLKENPDFKP
ncbi:MAG TPA: NUMOD1 domain-containing DNA-binding protein [Nitrososphaeraceae archaeon]|nr:NUMOD1 domain-containing DNA-binding protein [Nitrososphaeraceae archaeon]